MAREWTLFTLRQTSGYNCPSRCPECIACSPLLLHAKETIAPALQKDSVLPGRYRVWVGTLAGQGSLISFLVSTTSPATTWDQILPPFVALSKAGKFLNEQDLNGTRSHNTRVVVITYFIKLTQQCNNFVLFLLTRIYFCLYSCKSFVC